MNNVTEFLSKLDEVVWTKDVSRDECIKGILRDGSSLVDVEVTLHTKIEVVWTKDVSRDECIKGILRDGIGSKSNGLVDVEVNIRTTINNLSGNRTMPFNLNMYVNIDGSRVSFWGCEDIEAQLVMTEWFLKRGVEAHRFEMTLKDNSEAKAKALFNSL